ncbi:MAG: serine/threonine protein phosphatase [Sphingomonadales bacterium]|nr:MAG: serine/threonine protein phosphatase [Sphingomonadales bacterium]
MLRKLFSLGRNVARAAPAGTIPPGQRLYVIGDIHGRFDLLETLLERIDADDAGRSSAETALLFLGDLVDRGPQSAQVVERLLQLSLTKPATRFLLGNHEEVFLASLSGDVQAFKFFTRIGGRETVLSYGISEEQYRELDYAELLDWFISNVPADHRAFLERFEDMIIVGDYAFVHAGIAPGTSLAQQKVGDLRWIRGPFLEHHGPLEKIIVHGHTISPAVEIRPHRIGLDTGAYSSGNLTAMAFEADRRWVLDTSV